MKRRRFVAAMGSALAFPSVLRAQVKQKSIGFLSLARQSNPSMPRDERPAAIALRKLGWIRDKNASMISRFADGRAERLPELAAELVKEGVDVIWAIGPEAATAAARATKTIPIVFLYAPWPERRELVDSYARPGRNVTGIAWPDGLHLKRFELLREIAPAVRRIAWLTVPSTNETVSGKPYDDSHEFTVATTLRFEMRKYPVETLADINSALAKIQTSGAQGLAVATAPILEEARHLIAEFALKLQLPSAFLATPFVVAGGLCAWSVSQAEMRATFQRSFEYVDRILKGARPADLPVEQPSKFELAINLKTARAIGLQVPQPLLARADRIIE